MIQVIFVCLGNICRSPLAEAIFHSKLSNDEEFDIENVKISSAATSDWNLGHPADHRSIHVASKYQYTKINSHQAKKLTMKILECEKTFIICMDQSNVENVKKILYKKHENDSCFAIHLFSDFGLEKGTEVPDPYYGEIEDFEAVLKQCERYSDEFIDYLKITEK